MLHEVDDVACSLAGFCPVRDTVTHESGVPFYDPCAGMKTVQHLGEQQKCNLYPNIAQIFWFFIGKKDAEADNKKQREVVSDKNNPVVGRLDILVRMVPLNGAVDL